MLALRRQGVVLRDYGVLKQRFDLLNFVIVDHRWSLYTSLE